MTSKLFPVLWAILTVLQLGQAQIEYNPQTNTLLCSKEGGHYCLNGSLQGSAMLSCASKTLAEIRTCGIELEKILPEGYEGTAACYESSSSAGDALCAFNGTGYTLDGSQVKIPETVLCDAIISPQPGQINDDDNNTIQFLTHSENLEPGYQLSSTTPEAEAPICSNPSPKCTTCMSGVSTKRTTTTKTTTKTTTSPKTSLTPTTLPTDPPGRPYSVISQIMSEATASGSGSGTSSPSPKGIVLVEPSEPVTTGGGVASSMGTVVFGLDGFRVVFLVVVVGMVSFGF